MIISIDRVVIIIMIIKVRLIRVIMMFRVIRDVRDIRVIRVIWVIRPMQAIRIASLYQAIIIRILASIRVISVCLGL